LEVIVADLSYANFKERLATLELKSGEGLWMAPSRDFTETDTTAPIDLIYLDQDCRVIDTIESFPYGKQSSANDRAASVLALPTHSIYSSQTQAGDQLVICVAEEMESRLERFSISGPAAPAVQSVAVLREIPLWSGGPGLLQLKDRSKEEPSESSPVHEIALLEPGNKQAKPPKTWSKRWWSPDPRKAPRDPAPGLAAYYWNGATPRAHSVRDISSTGLYLVTEERWYPGTLVLMTLQKTASGEQSAERSIAVHSRAVRWGNDGVGLQFVLPDSHHPGSAMNPVTDGAGRKELERFLQQLRKGN
jgi:hypothetical protein